MMQDSLFDLPEIEPEPDHDRRVVLVHFADLDDRRAFEQAIGRRVVLTSRARISADEPPMFGPDEGFRREWAVWKGMPEYVMEDLQPVGSTVMEFDSEAELIAFEKLIGQTFQRSTSRVAAVWFPKAGHGNYSTKRYRAIDRPTTPRFPVFVPTKGRWESRYTIKTFDELGIPYRAVVEPQEVDEYIKAGVPEESILVLPHRDKGLVATRNWIWDRALEEGHSRFWTFDDNIRGLFRLNRNLKTPVVDGAMMRAIEDFAVRYENLPLCGMNYFMFAVRKAGGIPPVYLNNRVYSNGLIETDFRDPRGRPYRNTPGYNDDTDLNLRIVKDGNCTVLFNAFLIYKMVTMTVKGGIEYTAPQQVDPRYEALAREAVERKWYQTPEDAGIDDRHMDTRWRASVELVEKHPDVARITRKFGRWHHQVDYGPWRRNELRLREDVELPDDADDFGMVLERVDAQTGEHVAQESPWYPWEDGQ